MRKTRHDPQSFLDKTVTISDEDRAILAEERTAVQTPPGLSGSSARAWLGEVERRARAAVAGSPGLPWEAVHARVRSRLDTLERGL